MNVKISFISLLSLFFIGCSSVSTNIEVDEISLLPPIPIPIYRYDGPRQEKFGGRTFLYTKNHTYWDSILVENPSFLGGLKKIRLSFYAFQNKIKGTVPIYSHQSKAKPWLITLSKSPNLGSAYDLKNERGFWMSGRWATVLNETFYAFEDYKPGTAGVDVLHNSVRTGDSFYLSIDENKEFAEFYIYTVASLKSYKPTFFLENLDSLNLLGDNSNIIKKELRKIENKIKEKIDIPYFSIEIKEAVTERVITSSSMSNRNKDLLFQATLQNPNMTEYEYEYLKQQLNQNTYATRENSPREEIRKNTVITFDKDLFTIKPEWKDVVDFYGGYSELANKNINKKDYDLGLYNAKVKLSSFELLNSNECLAIVDISGELELNNIPKNQYKYKGTYKIEDIEIIDIYLKNLPNVIFSFENKKYLGSSNEFSMPINSITKLNIPFDNYISIIDVMFDDAISDEEFIEILTKILGE
jgi:hypothetical protein